MNKKYIGPENDGVYEIDLLELLSVFKRHIVAIIFVALLGTGLGYGATYVVPPKYKATSSIFVVSASSGSILDLSDLNLGTSLAKDYVDLVVSRTMLERVIETSGCDYTADQLQQMVSIENAANTRIIKFTVTTFKKDEAKLLADTFANEAIEYLPEVMGFTDNQPVLIDSALAPTGNYNISYVKFMAIGFIVGACLAMGIYTLKYITNDTINSSHDMEKYFDITPLASIPENGQRHHDGGYYAHKKGGKS